ncbi:hypothetical protein G6F42_017276 [Rhizopus arrhizus]|nr:hypothetical protein G6F42_017276 [Rhizopus arrhizus]
MPFGLTNAPATMQRLMDSVLAGLKWQICLVYLDDIVVFSSSFDQHLQDLRAVLSRLRAANLSANLKKCRFASQEISYLGYIISPEGLKTDPAKIRAVSEFPVPTSTEMLRSFLGLAGYYRSFIRKFSAIAAPLNALLKRDAPWDWTSDHQAAYATLKSALLSAPVLRFPDFSRPFELHTDGACTAGIGVTLCQRDPQNNRVYAVAFASRSLSPNERNYYVSEIEALAIIWGIRKFAHYLTGTKFTVVTDHQALQFFDSLSSDLRGRLARWSLYLQQHDYTIVYRPGKENSGPDALSRYPVPGPALCSLTGPDLRSAQESDPYCQELRSAPLSSGFLDESGVLFFGSRPVLPESLWNEMFDLLHANPTTGHLGANRTLQRFSRLFYFPNQREWVKNKISSCETCQRVKSSRTTLGHTNLTPSDSPVTPFDTIAIDTSGPLPRSTHGNKYIIVTQCLFSRYVIVTPVPENNDTNVIYTLKKIMAEHGVPRVIMSDNGQPYSSHLLKRLAEHLKIKQKYVPAYHPQSNGLVERFMETLRNMIVAFMDLNQNQFTWDEHLSEFQLAYNSSIHEATKFSPFSVVHGREARLLASPDFGARHVPVPDYLTSTQASLSRALQLVNLENTQTQAKNAIQYNTHRKPPAFQVDDLVLVDFPVLSNSAVGRSSKLTKKYRGPYRIIKVLSSDRFDVQDSALNKVWSNVHAERMKPYKQANEDIASSSPPDVASRNSFDDINSDRLP